MSIAMSGEPKMQEANDSVVCSHKCRIPQRLAPGRQRTPLKHKGPNIESVKNKADIVNVQQSRHGGRAATFTNELKPTPPPPKHSTTLTFVHNINARFAPQPEHHQDIDSTMDSRPKSANRATDDSTDPTHPTPAFRSTRPERERLLPAQKKPIVTVQKRTPNEKPYDVSSNKAGRQIITVPVRQKFTSKAPHNKLSTNLPDQETIRRCEELELQQEDFSDAAQMYNNLNNMFLDFNEEESVTSRSDQVLQLKNCWQEKIVQFEEMKNELNDRQNAILEVYAALRNTKYKLMAIGHTADLPFTDDLRIMNVANMTPNQLLQLCAETKIQKDDNQQAKNALTLDMKKLNEMPLKLVSVCEQTLILRKELIDWFENLKNQDKGCPKSCISKKINEFNAENEMLNGTLETVKTEFLNELNDFLRTCWNKSIGLQLRNEELTYEVSELNSQNADLKKHIYNVEKQKTHANKMKVEELEKELREEKMKKNSLRDRLTRAEGQVKIGDERASLLEAALNQARIQIRTLERSVQQSHEKNEQLREDFDDELNKLKESMKKNTIHLEEIAIARETLQQEKEDLKKKLEELSKHYNESLNNMKQEHSKSIAKFIDAEKKYNEEVEEKKLLQKTVESQCAHLIEYELRVKDTLKQLCETENALKESMIYKENFERTKDELDKTNANLVKLESHILEQTESIKQLEHNLKESLELEKKLNCVINEKDEHIVALEKKQNLLQRELQENERKMEIYEEQLTSLKDHITTLQDHVVQVENLNELKDLVDQENNKLIESKRINEELAKDFKEKQSHLKYLIDTIAEQEGVIKQKHNVYQKLLEKIDEHSNIIQLTQKVGERDAEIESLITNIKTRKEQISQLEKIILAMESQSRKAAVQRKRDQDKINCLEKMVAEYEYCMSTKSNKIAPAENLDNLIKMLEEELGTPFESQLNLKNNDYDTRKTKNVVSHNECCHSERESNYQPEGKAVPAKIVMGNFVKKTYIPSNDDKHNSESLHRRQAITNIDTQKWIAESDGESVFVPSPSLTSNNNFVYASETEQIGHPHEKFLKKLQYLATCKQSRDEKKSKMFKLASHRLA